MNKKTIGIGIIATLVVGVAIWYLMVYRKEGGAAAAAIKQAPGLGDADTAAFNAMLEHFKTNSDPSALSWLLPYVDQTMKGTNLNPLSPDYKISGQLSKSGTFLGEYARAYYPGGQFYGKKPEEEGYEDAQKKFNDTMYSIWQGFKSQYLQNQLATA